MFIGYDPDIYIAEDSKKFNYQDFEGVTLKPESSAENIKDDVGFIIDQILKGRVDLTTSYAVWRDIGFAFADQFGEKGRKYFHDVSQFYPEYSIGETNILYWALHWSPWAEFPGQWPIRRSSFKLL